MAPPAATPLGHAHFDGILGGGFPKASAILITGGTGSGKTVFVTQYPYRGIGFRSGTVVYDIDAEGLRVFPKIPVAGFTSRPISRNGSAPASRIWTRPRGGAAFNWGYASVSEAMKRGWPASRGRGPRAYPTR